jgi:CTD kinase subunit beta
MLAKIARTLGHGEEVKAVYNLAWVALTDLYRTFAPLKQTSVTLALSMMELAARLLNAEYVLFEIERYDLTKVETTREETMETILDSLDLYIQHTAASTLGTQYSLDDFLRLRLALKKECDSNNIPRNCNAPAQASPGEVLPASRVQNGHPTPVSPPQNGTTQVLPAPVRLEHRPPVSGGTLRFMLNPQLAHDERKQVEDFFIEEWEEYEEEIEVPLPRTEKRQGPPSSRASSRGGRSDDRRDERERPAPRNFDDHRREERARVDRERERLYDRDVRDTRRPPPPRDSRRYEDSRRGYPDDRDRRYDERPPRYDDRRPPRDDRRYPRDERDSRR